MTTNHLFALTLYEEVTLFFYTLEEAKQANKELECDDGIITYAERTDEAEEQMEMQEMWMEKMSRPGRMRRRHNRKNNKIP